MIIITTPSIPGYKIKKIKGVVDLTARTRDIGGKFIAGLQSIVGGEVSAYTTETHKAREEAIRRMCEEAQKIGANAVIGLDIETTEISQGIVLISATGAAVVVETEEK